MNFLTEIETALSTLQALNNMATTPANQQALAGIIADLQAMEPQAIDIFNRLQALFVALEPEGQAILSEILPAAKS
jgi:hypothetical protein